MQGIGPFRLLGRRTICTSPDPPNEARLGQYYQPILIFLIYQKCIYIARGMHLNDDIHDRGHDQLL